MYLRIKTIPSMMVTMTLSHMLIGNDMEVLKHATDNNVKVA